MAKTRTGTIQMHGGQLQARHRITIDGVTVRKWFPLGTKSIGLARAKNKDLVAKLLRGEIPTTQATAALETCAAAFTRYVERAREDGLKSWGGRAQVLRDYAEPVIGSLRIDEVGPPHIRDVLDRAKQMGKAKASLEIIRCALSQVFDMLCREELLSRNPVKLVKMPKMEKDKRPRATPTDPEFIQFVTFEPAPLRLRTMAVVSRTFGGMRTSDLHAWDWKHIDSHVLWNTALIRRPKTDAMRRQEIPEEIRPWLRQWWEVSGQPTSGPVFGLVNRPGVRYKRTSYASELRHWLLAAGVDRHELHHDTEETRRVDFHSFRRAYCSALAVSGVNAQTAMQLAEHSKLETHLMYTRGMALAAPAGIVPAMGPAVGPSPAAARRAKPSNSNGNAALAPEGHRPGVSNAMEQAREPRAHLRLFLVRPANGRRLFYRLLAQMGPNAWTKEIAPGGAPDEPATAAE